MGQSPKSLKHEYQLYVEREIEDYKDSIPRSAILGIGDEAVATLRSQEQFEFNELVLWDEVDRIIRQRLRIPAYATWRRRRLKLLAEYRRPEHWGWEADAPVVRAIQPKNEARVLVAGENVEGSALYFAAHGCVVTAVQDEPDIVERVISAAERVGLTRQVTGVVSGLNHWMPEEPLAAVVCTPAAFAGLSADERSRVIALLQGATQDGGVHLVETIVAGQRTLSLDELRTSYLGWDVSVESGGAGTFLARKGMA
jgi:hypothetical protein